MSLQSHMDGCSSMWPNMRIMRQMRRGHAKELAYGFAQAVDNTTVPIEGDSSADPGEISQFVIPLLDGSGFRQENPSSSRVVYLRELSNA